MAKIKDYSKYYQYYDVVSEYAWDEAFSVVDNDYNNLKKLLSAYRNNYYSLADDVLHENYLNSTTYENIGSYLKKQHGLVGYHGTNSNLGKYWAKSFIEGFIDELKSRIK